jgi:hypothetical protein
MRKLSKEEYEAMRTIEIENLHKPKICLVCGADLKKLEGFGGSWNRLMQHQAEDLHLYYLCRRFLRGSRRPYQHEVALDMVKLFRLWVNNV